MKLLKINNIIIILLLLLCISFLIGLLAFKYLPSFPQVDQKAYNEVAIGILDNFQFNFTTSGHLLAPAYPLFLAIIYKIAGQNYNIIYFIQYLLLGLISFFEFLIAYKYLKIPKPICLGTAIITITWPYLLLYSNLLLSEILFICIFIIIIFLLLKYSENTNISIFDIALLSSLLAIATLTRPVVLMLPAWLLILIYIWNKFFKKYTNITLTIKNLFFICILYFLLLAPWIAFVSIKAGKFTPIVTYSSIMINKANITYEYKTYQTHGYENGQNLSLR